MAGTALKLIVGLGNPDPEYLRTRHNAGFWFVEELARRHGGVFKREAKHQGELARIRIGDSEIWLLKPMTYMNRSGGPTRSVATFYKIPVEEILVAHDELDFPPGVVKLKQGGGAAGNNGIRDLIAQIGDAFWRLRIGVGKPQATGIEHVLSRPSVADEQLIRECIAKGADIVAVMLERGGEIAMNRLHARPASTTEKDPPPSPPSAAPTAKKDPGPAPPSSASTTEKDPRPASASCAPTAKKDPGPSPPPAAPTAEKDPRPAPPAEPTKEN